ncbi:MAG: DUF5060 domain-containing protein [Verrucomicrobiia bacterium]
MKRRGGLAVLAAAALALGHETVVGQPQTGATPDASSLGPSLEQLPDRVPAYGRVEVRIGVPSTYTNPFNPDEVELDIEITNPGGQRVTVPAFWCQDYDRVLRGRAGRQRDWIYPAGMPRWKARFAVDQPGAHTVVARLKDNHGIRASAPQTFLWELSPSKGFVRVARKDPRFLEFSQGQPFFPIGQNLAFVGPAQHVTLSRAEDIFAKLGANGANYLRLWTCCEDWAMAIEARKSAWGRSWDWRPPLERASTPEGSNRWTLKLSTEKPALNLEPSHPVALRPGTQYVLRGWIKTEGDSRVRLELPGGVSPTYSSSAASQPATSESTNWLKFEQSFTTGPAEYWLGTITFQREGSNPAWITDLSLQEDGRGPELLWEADINRPLRGFYNPIDCFMLDEVVAAAEKHGIYLQLCLLTRDLYMSALKDPASAEYDSAIADAKKLMRYAVARWGSSTSVAAWEYWNEMNPGLPTDRFYREVGQFLEQTDPHRHLRTTSAWGPAPKDCRHSKLDIADVHFYLRPTDAGRLRDEVDAVLERTRWLREQAPAKPAHLGEIGLADDQWRITDAMRKSSELADVHNVLWASALSGASGTALPWWWERIDQRDGYDLYRPLSAFIADVPWNSGRIASLNARGSDPEVRIPGVQADGKGWLWVFTPGGSWASLVTHGRNPPTLDSFEVEVRDWPAGTYRIRWWDTWKGSVIRDGKASVDEGVLRLEAPPFSRDIACKIEPDL